MTIAHPNATITTVAGAAANVPAQLQCLSLDEIGRQAAFGIDADHRLHFGASPGFAANATLAIDGEDFRVARVRLACHTGRLGEALLKKL